MRLEEAFPDLDHMVQMVRDRMESLSAERTLAIGALDQSFSDYTSKAYENACEMIDVSYDQYDAAAMSRGMYLNSIRSSVHSLNNTPKYRDPGMKNVGTWYVREARFHDDELSTVVLDTEPVLHVNVGGKEFPVLAEYYRDVEESPPLWYARVFAYTPHFEAFYGQMESRRRLLKREGDTLLLQAT